MGLINLARKKSPWVFHFNSGSCNNCDIELIDVDADKVIVALRGMCAQCALANITMRDLVEAKLREFVSGEICVEEAKDAPGQQGDKR